MRKRFAGPGKRAVDRKIRQAQGWDNGLKLALRPKGIVGYG